jgi:hypothetical protein
MRLRTVAYFVVSYSTLLLCGVLGIKGLTLLESAIIGIVISPAVAYIAEISVSKGELKSSDMRLHFPRVKTIRMAILMLLLSHIIIFGSAAALNSRNLALIVSVGLSLLIFSLASLSLVWLIFKESLRRSGISW